MGRRGLRRDGSAGCCCWYAGPGKVLLVGGGLICGDVCWYPWRENCSLAYVLARSFGVSGVYAVGLWLLLKLSIVVLILVCVAWSSGKL